jgi:uncharacterized membrane protein HdeD (DUF308 family)
MSDSVTVEEVVVVYPWWTMLLQGIAGVIIGLLLLGAGDITTAQGTLVVVQILGWYWFFTGIMNLILMFVDSTMWGWKLFIGLVGMAAGISIIQHPLWATGAVPLVFVVILGIEGVMIGIVEIVQGFQGAGWGRGLLGVLSIFLGGWLIANRFVAALALPWVAGVFALILGVAANIFSFQFRKAERAATA